MGKKSSSAGSVEHLDTSAFTQAVNSFRASINQFNDTKDTISNTTNALINSWVGSGRNTFEAEYMLISGQLKDIIDELSDLCDAIIDANITYLEVDEELKQQLVME